MNLHGYRRLIALWSLLLSVKIDIILLSMLHAPETAWPIVIGVTSTLGATGYFAVAGIQKMKTKEMDEKK